MEISYSEYLTLKEIVGRYESKSKPNPNHSLPKELLDKEIWELGSEHVCGTSVRLYNVMKNGMGLRTVRDMIELSVNDFLRQRNFGKKCLKELQDIYEYNGIEFVK